MSNSTTTAPVVRPWAMSLPPRSGAALVPADGETIDTRSPEWAAAGSAAYLLPGLYTVKRYVTKAGDESAHVTASHPATDAALKVRQAERKLSQARALLAGAPALPTVKAPGKGKGKGKGKPGKGKGKA